jgi:transposase
MDRKPYKTDLTDAQWAILEPLLPKAKPGGRPRSVDMLEIVNAILYVLHTGIQWEMMPHDLSPHTTVYTYYDQWNKDGHWPVINARLVALVKHIRFFATEALGACHSGHAPSCWGKSLKARRSKCHSPSFTPLRSYTCKLIDTRD